MYHCLSDTECTYHGDLALQKNPTGSNKSISRAMTLIYITGTMAKVHFVEEFAV